MKVKKTTRGSNILNQIGFYPITLYDDFCTKIGLISKNDLFVIKDETNFFYPISKGYDPRFEDVYSDVVTSKGDTYYLDVYMKYIKPEKLKINGIRKIKEPISLEYIKAYAEVIESFKLNNKKDSVVMNLMLNIIADAFYSRRISIKVTTSVTKFVDLYSLYNFIQNRQISYGFPITYGDIMTKNEMCECLFNPSIGVPIVERNLNILMKKWI